MSIGKMKILRTGLIALLAVALIFTMTFTSRVTALDEGLDINEAAQQVLDKIDDIPEIDDLELTSEHKALIKDARTAYDEFMSSYGEALQSEENGELSGTLKTAYGKLIAAETQMGKLEAARQEALKKKAKAVVAKINKIPAISKLKLTHNKYVKAARNAYTNLSKAEKKYLTDNYADKYSRLQRAEAKIKKLTRAMRLAKQEAAKVTKKIRKIPKYSKIKYKHKKRVKRAYKAYKKLKKSSRKYVPKKQRTKLFKAVKKIKRYEKKIKAFKKAKTSVKLYTSERLNIKVAWKKIKRAKKYIVYRKTTDDKYHKVKVTKERSFIDKNRYKTTRNVYKVKAVTEIGGKKVYSKYSKEKNKSLLAKSTIVKATAYSGGGHCANGMPVGVGRIATDPRYIPLGTWLYVEGYGLSQACDTGGAIKGWFIDVYFTSNSTCNRWGVKYPRVWILK